MYRPKPGRKQSFTATDVIKAARAEGVASFTLGAVAARLDVKPSALYRVFKSRADLQLAVLEDIVRTSALQIPAEDGAGTSTTRTQVGHAATGPASASTDRTRPGTSLDTPLDTPPDARLDTHPEARPGKQPDPHSKTRLGSDPDPRSETRPGTPSITHPDTWQGAIRLQTARMWDLCEQEPELAKTLASRADAFTVALPQIEALITQLVELGIPGGRDTAIFALDFTGDLTFSTFMFMRPYLIPGARELVASKLTGPARDLLDPIQMSRQGGLAEKIEFVIRAIEAGVLPK